MIKINYKQECLKKHPRLHASTMGRYGKGMYMIIFGKCNGCSIFSDPMPTISKAWKSCYELMINNRLGWEKVNIKREQL